MNNGVFAPAYRVICSSRIIDAARELILVIPILAAGIFVWRYAISYPLTDEWLLLRNAMIAHDMGWSDPVSTFSAMTWGIYNHPLVLPNILYLMIAPVFHYDARALIFITLVCFASMLIVFRSEIASNAWTALPAALVLFAPSHYMEYMWGFQFAMAMSVALPVLGLAVFNRSSPEESATIFSTRLVCALSLIMAGVLCQAVGALGFPALLVLALFMRLSSSRRHVVIGISLLAFAVTIESLPSTDALQMVPQLDDIMVVLTALGAVLVGSPVGLTTFPFDWTAALGLSICAVVVLCTLLAWRRHLMSEVAFPLALFVFGLLAITTVALSRPYLGNWHLQVALPAILGAYGTAIILARHLVSPGAFILQAIMTGLVAMLAIGYWQGYSRFGPEYNAYANSVADYMRAYLADPDATKPYPPTGGWDFDSAMARFLRDNGPQS
jgi:general stress protein CsbA